ncbi:MAG: hypothetical protein JWM05_3088, partial [Acidimicrobiales bacterium]|nr:hypothetical protein [Acidimicrobiales bacterium]
MRCPGRRDVSNGYPIRAAYRGPMDPAADPRLAAATAALAG